MKNQPYQDTADLPSWGGGPRIHAEDTVEDGNTLDGKGNTPTGNAIGQGSCINCELP